MCFEIIKKKLNDTDGDLKRVDRYLMFTVYIKIKYNPSMCDMYQKKHSLSLPDSNNLEFKIRQVLKWVEML